LVGRLVEIIKRYSVALSWVYLTIFIFWAAAHSITGDRYPPITLLNTIGPYLFIPMPFVTLVAFLSKRKELWAGTVFGAVLFALFWGRLFLPSFGNGGNSVSTITVMTYNVLGTGLNPQPAIEVMKSVDADVVFLQEINPILAGEIEAQLGERYPFRVISPREGVSGMGTVSKYQLEPTDETLLLKWVGEPQVLQLEWSGKSLTLINFHMWPAGIGPMWVIDLNTRGREAQALILTEFALQFALKGPVIAAGDANATPLSDAYRRITSTLEDSWAEAGFGLGHTYPGVNAPVVTRLQASGLPLPRWLFRIDYLFHSSHLRTVDAQLAPFDGTSDHRGVIATLMLVDP
jgi:vancomycin resistance protein VanJ